MTVAHTKHTGGLNMFRNHGEEFRSFGSEGPIRRHGERDKASVPFRFVLVRVRVQGECTVLRNM